MRKRRTIPIKKKPDFAIVVDGETEFWYFQMLVRNEKERLNVRIKPELPSKKSLPDQFKLVKELAEDYTKTFWIIDLDVILRETREAKKGAKSAIETFDEYLLFIRKNYPKKVAVIVNKPCLEFWLLLHFESTSKFFDTCSGAERQLKKHLEDYEKTGKYFTKQGNDIYLKLKPKLMIALENANKLGVFDIKEPNKAMSEMELFFEAQEFNGLFVKA